MRGGKPVRVLLCNQSELARFEEIENDLTTFQSIVGGLIESVPFFQGTVLICNEEAKMLQGFKPNRFVALGGTLDLIYGNFFLCGFNGEDFADIPLAVENVLMAKMQKPHFDKNGEQL